jgi:hypothetical protein
MAVIEDLEQITDRQRVLYHERSSAEILVSVEAHLGLLASLLRGSQPEPVRHRIASAAAEAAGFAAWLLFDLAGWRAVRATRPGRHVWHCCHSTRIRLAQGSK